MARYRSLLGLIMLNILSRASKMHSKISSSFRGAGRSSGWEHGCITPFMSIYKLSNSTPFGFGADKSTAKKIDYKIFRKIDKTFFQLTDLVFWFRRPLSAHPRRNWPRWPHNAWTANEKTPELPFFTKSRNWKQRKNLN